MKILLDANISFKLKNKLASNFKNIEHVDWLDIKQPASDVDIWNWAKSNDFMIITNDDDFYHFSNVYGFPPKVVLLKTGNQSTNNIAKVLIKHINDIHQLYNDVETGLLEIF
jgi:predicted nuclease of predicted toxin-antitoxin system